jgi:hypothetical protein
VQLVSVVAVDEGRAFMEVVPSVLLALAPSVLTFKTKGVLAYNHCGVISFAFDVN